MGGTTFSRDDFSARTTAHVKDGTPVFAHTAAINAGDVAAKVHKNLDPHGVKIREARDSDAHPISVPIAVPFDTTGSMADVPRILQRRLAELMGHFIDDKVSGKKYLGDGYPAIMVGGIDDFSAMGLYGSGNGCLQIGQFESGIEIDDNLANLWLTGHGGGTYDESYELALYFMARHTAHDHFEKRGRKGYLFLIGDEHAYPAVDANQVKAIIGDSLQADIPLKEIVAEVKERYHVFFIIPNNTSHYTDSALEKYWVELLGQQNCLKLSDPEQICEMIVGAVALCENFVGLDELKADGVLFGASSSALVPLSKSIGSAVSQYSAEGLPSVSGPASGIERI